MSPLDALVIAPLAFALASLGMGRRGAWLIVIAAPVMIALAVWLCVQVWAAPVGHSVGGWAPPLGIAIRADGLSAAFMLASAVAAGLIGLFALGEFAPPKDGETARSHTFWPLLYLLWAAVNAIFASADLFNLYVALELLTIAAVALAGFGALKAALRYFMVALLGSLSYLLGAVLIYAAYGTLDMGLLAQRAEADLPTLLAAGFITAGLIAKTALFPLHGWLPPAHGSAPAPASALLSALVVKASFFILLRFWFDAMPGIGGPALAHLLGALGAAAVIYGSVQAIRQTELKPLVAYSTVAQLGYLFLVFPLAGGADEAAPWAAGAWSGGVFHALSHLFAKAAMFLAAGLMLKAAATKTIGGLEGLARAMPVTVFAFAVSAVSLMALPPSGGFMAKYLLLTSALAAGAWIYAAVMIAGGLLAAVYLFRPLARAFAGKETPVIAPTPRWLAAIPLALALLASALGLASAGPYAFIQTGAPLAAEEGLE